MLLRGHGSSHYDGVSFVFFTVSILHLLDCFYLFITLHYTLFFL